MLSAVLYYTLYKPSSTTTLYVCIILPHVRYTFHCKLQFKNDIFHERIETMA